MGCLLRKIVAGIENFSDVTEQIDVFQMFDLLELKKDINSSDTDIRNAAANRLRFAVKDIGFLYIKNHGILESEFQKFSTVTQEFFSQPTDELEKMITSPDLGVLRGITLLEGESTARIVGKGDYSDLCMKYTMGNDHNIFPNENFREQWVSYYKKIVGVARDLLNLIGQVLDLDTMDNWKDMMLGDPLLRHLNYPDVPEERCADVSDLPRMAAHHDLDLITLLYQTPSPNGFISLQAQINDKFHDVPAIPGTLVVNFGEILSILTNGAVKATTHQVLAPNKNMMKESRRTSTVCFFQPKPNFVVKPLRDSDFSQYNADDTGAPFKDWIARMIEQFSISEKKAQKID
jgi:deacetoxycephalosporin-C synthase